MHNPNAETTTSDTLDNRSSAASVQSQRKQRWHAPVAKELDVGLTGHNNVAGPLVDMVNDKDFS